MTLTYNPRLAKVKVDRHAKNQCQVKQESTHDATKRIIAPAMRLIKNQVMKLKIVGIISHK